MKRLCFLAAVLTAVGAFATPPTGAASSAQATLTVAVQNRAADPTAKPIDTQEKTWSWSAFLDYFTTMPCGMLFFIR